MIEGALLLEKNVNAIGYRIISLLKINCVKSRSKKVNEVLWKDEGFDFIMYGYGNLLTAFYYLGIFFSFFVVFIYY